MPEMHFTVEWPDGVRDRCYSPSTVVEEHLSVGADYAVGDFLDRISQALEAASERVRARYGFACSSAIDQQGAIVAKAASLSDEQREGRVRVLSFEKHAPRDAKVARAPGGEG